MYRDDLAATHARVEQLQRELTQATSRGAQDKQRIAELTAQLAALQQALSRAVRNPQAQLYQNALPSRASTILVLGILSLVVCGLLGPIAWSMGTEELRRIDAGETLPDGRSNVVAGRVCGIVASVFLIFGGLMMFVLLAV